MILEWLNRRLAAFLTKRVESRSISTTDFEALRDSLQPCDVLLIDGDTRISKVIKYLTQSTWSHSALYLGPDAGLPVADDGEPHVLIEADLEEGIRTLPLSFYRHDHSRICHPVGLREEDIDHIARFSKERIGHQYDMKNVFDLARYLVPLPVPGRYRRRAMAFGSGDPSRAICSSFIAQAFQSIRYPILPKVKTLPAEDPRCIRCERELFSIRHHSLFTPRDFDASPYFQIIKPSLAEGFDYREIDWEKHERENR
ncbi:Permuted papain-like amidase enzyme, YaeF/YiiX, C92 family [Marinobacter daqiaonensis]|uniref:Permuted papain-like amidase enzyme, YaeF/YiiX, C92 family n=1 Tax=Marinobacter daqiaonensis TaxID=650891 RepID=A0A1I6GQ79_9GAMM|nr:lipo-like protein [Marinobacter daqiaonensis]SFR44251.1 Permuted papain-like amidase enzyme, YaeF/YiiX, C92 family [Marinobacter daqiaonensis]